MKLNFKTIHGDQVNVTSHTLESIKQNTSTQVIVGTDSQTIGEHTTYVTAIAYKYGNNGVHYIISKQKLPRVNDLWTRLWKEAEYTIEVAEWMKTHLPSVNVTLDLDYNDDAFFKSNQLISATKGWAQSLGYKVNTKPECLIAGRAADYHCR